LIPSQVEATLIRIRSLGIPIASYSYTGGQPRVHQISTNPNILYLNNVKGLVDGGLGIEREASINLGGDLSGNDLENLLAELNQELVKGGVNLLVDVLALFQLSE
jgi:hypothetical protein